VTQRHAAPQCRHRLERVRPLKDEWQLRGLFAAGVVYLRAGMMVCLALTSANVQGQEIGPRVFGHEVCPNSSGARALSVEAGIVAMARGGIWLCNFQ
jgi:hypothetical protein